VTLSEFLAKHETPVARTSATDRTAVPIYFVKFIFVLLSVSI
jgi:hypothetical protein